MGTSCSCSRDQAVTDDLQVNSEKRSNVVDANQDEVAAAFTGSGIMEEQERKLTLDKAFKPLHFTKVNVERFNPNRDPLKLSDQGERGFGQLVDALKKYPDVIVKVSVAGNGGVKESPFMGIMGAQFVQEALVKQGLKNAMALEGTPGTLSNGVMEATFTTIDLEECNAVTKKTASVTESQEYRLFRVLMLELPFHGVDLKSFDPDKDTCELKSKALEHLDKIAGVLKDMPDVAIRVFGYTGQPPHSNCVKLSLARTRKVREALQERGVHNKIAAKGMGLADDHGPRCELAPCTVEEVERIEQEVLEAENPKEPTGPLLKLVFEEKGKEVEITLQKRPMGLTFLQNTMPIKITKVTPGGEAETRGVRPGMEMKSISGTPLAGMKYDKVFALLGEASKVLPES
mmetsp:Transcript_78263/g.162549  ORF Transcript_78263/g.162549 Transcript_78263/m.162549 type:complete len:402 (-) Transcript_78263:110-1315(-)|eukprot:CAMPEP_0206438652 /NCGR_PEP_ID=MMETSP0324_2-20121206/11762_1 /ASSEMBLY_ACC=CAM_ASM_000836 /TAXON_ID=2866 /ORGANISM="Crypthecodinium cohnii, Strain Seligo" /LENGTH=401 /DNA_ID=CAMNT_0053906161 /DNA_START=171 /DNA_END=1376 /DNA_ORIENTATION=+